MIPFLDLHSINKRFHSEFKSEFQGVLDASSYVLGQKVKEFETAYSKYCGTSHCIGTANGLDALTLILKGYIQLGRLQKGDKIIVPANTFIATILSVLHAELVPVFVEPDADTFNISVEEVEKHLSKDTKAVIVVHLYGQLADIQQIKQLTDKQDILLISDAAQAHGAETDTGQKAGSLCDAAAFSFYPSKNLGALGDGGAVTTNDENLVRQIELLRNYGSVTKYTNEVIGVNSRLDEMQAAFLSVKLKALDTDNALRQSVANRYLSEIKNPKIKLPFYNGSKNHVFYVFVIRIAKREDFIKYLNRKNIGNLIHYPVPPHKQKALTEFKHLYLPVTEAIHNTVVSIPIGPTLTENDITTIIETINAY